MPLGKFAGKSEKKLALPCIKQANDRKVVKEKAVG